ncbi:Chromosomal replication initiator protein DnaA [bacterium HR37]|nr:Chromosomal replication initiator protein DnaA [bacterium HR37]
MAKRVTLGRSLKSLFSKHEETSDKGLETLITPFSSSAIIRQKKTEDNKIEWENVLERIKKKSNPQVFFWFAPLKLVSQTEESVVLKAKSQFDRDWINNHYIDFISDTIKEVQGKKYEVKIIAENESPEVVREETDPDLPREAPKETLFAGFLNPNYTFERFVVGPSNQFAHAASVAVARKPGEAYNPLFIYGGVGLGKTHLINAIGNYILKNIAPMARVACISAEHFTNQVINSIKSNKMEEFRNRYRFGCDVLLIDDIQFIAGKESTQEEFFHTFNTLYESKKQIVITSDKSPKDMSYLEERLRSRFEWGLITDIQPPEMETKVAILKNKAESEGVVIPNEVAIYLAQNITSNIRELEGTLINIIGYAKLLNTEITLDLARDVLKNIIKEQDKRILSIESIQKEVSSFFGIRLQDLKSERKQKNIAIPRQIAMYLARRYTGASFPEIGEKFGGKDHSTVIHAVRKIETAIAEDSTLRGTVEAISRRIESLRNSG